jgi:hypothetical protein
MAHRRLPETGNWGISVNMPRVAELGGPAATVAGLAGLACLNGLGVEVVHGGDGDRRRAGFVVGVPVAFFLRDSLRALGIGA